MLDLRRQYTRLAPVYDGAVTFLDRARTRAVAEIACGDRERVVIPGVGTGQDLAYLPTSAAIRGVDLTPAMLAQAKARARASFLADCQLVEGDATALPFPDASFDVALLHLILAVVPDATAALREAARVVRPGGRASVLDKFVPKGWPDLPFRAIDPITRRIVTGVATRFEDVVAAVPAWRVVSDEPGAVWGFFRRIRLERR